MKAIRVHKFGPPDVLSYEDVDVPVPGEGQVLVRVAAAGVGPWDAWVRSGHSVLPQPLPLTPGSDIAGTVEALGPGVAGIRRGDAVYGVTNKRFTDGYAEYALASAATLAPKPASLDDVYAASVPVVAVAAQQALFEHARIESGQSVLIHGAGGSVGAYAVQFCKLAGAQVVATARSRDEDDIRALGADRFVNFEERDFRAVVSDVDAVIDLIGEPVTAHSLGVLKPGGVLVSLVSQPDAELARRHNVRATFMLVDVTTEALTAIAALFEAGKLAARVGTVLPLCRARLAHEWLSAPARKAGKIVLEVV